MATPKATPSPKWLGVMFLLAATCISLSPTLQNQFTNCDDVTYLLEEPAVRDLSAGQLVHIFTDFKSDIYKPMVILSFAVEYFFFGFAPQAYHTTNLLLHLLNTLLVYALCRHFTTKEWVPWMTALWFGIHPIHVESVAWVVERKDLLYSLFFLGSLLSYLQYRRSVQKKWFGISLFLFVLSMASKPMAVSLPLALLVIDAFLDGRLNKKRVLALWPYVLIALCMVFPSWYFQNKILNPHAIPVSIPRTAISIAEAVVFYCTKILYPAGLSFMYDFSHRPGTWLSDNPLISGGILGSFFCSVAYLAFKNKKFGFGVLLFLVLLAPALPLAPYRGVVADRYVYLASIGIFFIVCEFIWSRLPIVLFLSLSVIFSFMSFKQSKAWYDGLSLWQSVIQKYPHKIPNAYMGLGEELVSRGRLDEAILRYDEALHIRPDFVEVYLNRGQAYFLKKDYDRSLDDFSRLIALRPQDAKAWNNRGTVYSAIGKYENAVADLSRGLSLNNRSARAYYNRGFAYKKLNKTEAALSDFDRALDLNPWLFQAHVQKAGLLDDLGRKNEALNAYRELVTHAPSEDLAEVKLAKSKLAPTGVEPVSLP